MNLLQICKLIMLLDSRCCLDLRIWCQIPNEGYHSHMLVNNNKVNSRISLSGPMMMIQVGILKMKTLKLWKDLLNLEKSKVNNHQTTTQQKHEFWKLCTITITIIITKKSELPSWKTNLNKNKTKSIIVITIINLIAMKMICKKKKLWLSSQKYFQVKTISMKWLHIVN